MDTENSHTKVNTDLLFRFFGNRTAPEEEALISGWLKESRANKEIYNNASDLYEAMLLDAPIGVLDGSQTAPEKHVRRRKALRIAGWVLGNAAAIAVFALIGLHIIDRRYEDRLAHTMNTIVVPAGKSMDYILSDGTTVKLNSGARLQYPMTFSRDNREVRLDGEAYFDVARNERQPFIVRTFASDIRVLGTEFNVDADEKAGRFSATLVEGSVLLKSRLDGKEILMKPDQTVSLNGGELICDQRPVKSAVAWTEGLLDITSPDFGTLIEKLRKAFGVNIIIERDTMPELKYHSGELRISDGIDYAMTVVGNMADFTYTKDRKTGTIYIK